MPSAVDKSVAEQPAGAASGVYARLLCARQTKYFL